MDYVLIADVHAHTWSFASKINSNGINSRLQIILNEMRRAANEGLKRGVKSLVIAGDLFHVRGSIDPEVLNPVQETIREIIMSGVNIWMIPGNHDLKSKDTNALSSAIQTLSETFDMNGSVMVVNEPTAFTQGIAFIPWCSSNEVLMEEAEKLAVQVNNPERYDLIIHAGIDGVLPGMPGHGLSAQALAGLGFRNVFAGDYHNRKKLIDGVWSIGSLTHLHWGDIGSKAGFIIVKDNDILEFDTHAPKFIDVSHMSQTDAQLAADGNYVRYRGGAMTQKEMDDLRLFLEKSGALAVLIQAARATTTTRSGTTPTAGPARTLDQSISDYIAKVSIPGHIDRAEVQRRAADVLNTVRAVSAA